jgi:hypothetical protein
MKVMQIRFHVKVKVTPLSVRGRRIHTLSTMTMSGHNVDGVMELECAPELRADFERTERWSCLH